MDLTAVAHRMLHVAAAAILPAYSKATKRKAALAVSAALRELAESYDGQPIYYQDLRTLADSIEKGETRA